MRIKRVIEDGFAPSSSLVAPNPIAFSGNPTINLDLYFGTVHMVLFWHKFKPI
jgi:hypothetical protein